MMLDSFVQNSGGAYTHDKAFKLPLNFAYNLLQMWDEKAEYQARYSQIERTLKKH